VLRFAVFQLPAASKNLLNRNRHSLFATDLELWPSFEAADCATLKINNSRVNSALTHYAWQRGETAFRETRTLVPTFAFPTFKVT